MKPLQVFLDERDARRLEQWAARHDLTKSEAVRIAVRALTRVPEADPLLGLSGVIRGLPADLGERVDRYLQETFDASPPTPSRPRRRAGARRH